MDIKEKIKERVNDISDPQLLVELLRAVELEHEIDHIDVLTELEKKSIDEGIEEAESHKLHSTTEAKHLVREWLRE